jgi:Carboxypeptidase regulatory-like domain
MMRGCALLSVLPLILLSRPARACECMVSLSTCHEVGASDLVFIGTVELIEPMFLNRWNLTSPASIRSINDAYTGVREHPSAAALARLKDAYLKTFPELAAEQKNQVQAAKTVSDVTSLFYSSLSSGMRVRFRVKTVFKHEDDDDSPKDTAATVKDDKDNKDKRAKDDDDDRKKGVGKNSSVKTAGKGTKDDGDRKKVPGKNDSVKTAAADKDKDKDEKGDEDFFDVETAFGDCGYNFQEGETYLVYADSDEDSNVLSTSSCSRTRRLSDAGEDLTYLLVYKDRPEESTRLEGFTTTDEYYQLGFDQMHDPVTTKEPVAGAIVELQSDPLIRYAESDANGRFVFDGLRGGDYKVSAFAHGYPVETKLLAGPQQFHIEQKSCARQVLLLPKTYK